MKSPLPLLESAPWPRGCLQVYTGDGKGKTTAAFGLALRAAGRGKNVFVCQFMKSWQYGELVGAQMLEDFVTVEQFGSPECIPLREEPCAEDVKVAHDALLRAEEVINSDKYQIVILDEISVAVRFKLIKESELLNLVDQRPRNVEVICTGRWAPQSLIERADLVTEMKMVKHPYESDKLEARDGIER